MAKNFDQEFLNDPDDKLWKSADRLRNALDAANYKHVVLCIIFLKYVFDAFDERQNELRKLFAEKMERLTGLLNTQFAESARLEGEIKQNLTRLGYEF